MKENWFGKYIGEAIGDFMIVLFGTGLIHQAILHGQVSGLLQAGIGWGFAVAIAIWFGAALSGAHFNPSVTIALAWRRKFPWSQVVPFILAQIFGVFMVAVVLGIMFSSDISNYVAANNIDKAGPSGLILAMMYAPYSPHPAIYGLNKLATVDAANAAAYAAVPWWLGGISEFVMTAILMAAILNFLDEDQAFKPGTLFPLALGVVVTMIVFVQAPLAMTSLNAARDLGPRIWLWLNGYGQWAFPGLQWGGSTLATTVFPILGACFGAWFFDIVMKPNMGPAAQKKDEAKAQAAKPQPAAKPV